MVLVLSLQQWKTYWGIVAWRMSNGWGKFNNLNTWGISFLEFYILCSWGWGIEKWRRMINSSQVLSSLLFTSIRIMMERVKIFFFFWHIWESSACQEGNIFHLLLSTDTLFWGMLFTSIQLSCYCSLAYFLSDYLNCFSGFQVVQEKNWWQSANASFNTLRKES